MIGQDLFDANNGASLVSDGPVVGTSEPAVNVRLGTYLTTGDLAPGESGDAGNLAAFTVEFWLRATAVPSGGFQDTLCAGPNAHAAVPNRQWRVNLIATGQLIFIMTNSLNQTFQTTGGAFGISLNQWHHVVCAYGSNTFRVYLDGALWDTAGSGGTPWPDLVAGSADMRVGWATNTRNYDFAEFAFYRYELPAARALAHYRAGAQRGFPSQLASARVTAVLNSVSSTPTRTIGTAVRSLTPRYMTGQTPLDLIREAVQGEAIDSVFFTAKDGSLVFLASNHRASSPYNTVQATFGDAGGSELPYVDLTLDYSDSFLANEWNVTREGSAQQPGQTVTASDSTSISANLKRPQSLTGIPVLSDADSSTIAAAMLAKYKTAMQRVTSLTFSTIDSTVAAVLFSLELMDKITVKRTAPGGGARISQDLWIQKIDVSGANDGHPWTVVFGVSPL